MARMKRSIAWLAAFALGAAIPSLASACGGMSPDSGAPPASDGASEAARDGGGDSASDDDGAERDAFAEASEAGAPDANGCVPPTAAPIVVASDVTVSASWTCDHVYLVQGTIKVLAPATLTIAAGTTVLLSNDTLNNGSILVGPGAQIVAIGTRDLPIVFTSSALGSGAAPKPGDWGTLALVGQARGNWGVVNGQVATSGSPDDANEIPGKFPFTAGGNDASHDTDSSGTLQFVRIEYGGTVRNSHGNADHEMLGLYGAGSGTLLDFVDIRQGMFGCLFAQGGAFRARHLICQYGGESGGFDFSRGNQSRAQFILVQENPNRSSEGIGFKGAGDVNQLPPLTTPSVYNVTACGTNGGIDKKDPYAFFMRRAPGGILANFIGTGYFAGLAMTGGSALADGGILAATTHMESSRLFGNFDPFADGGTNIVDPAASTSDTDLTAWFQTPGWLNSTADPRPNFGDCFDANTLRAAPKGAITAGAATPPSDGFFDNTATYLGAFKDNTSLWASGNWVTWSDH
jgi:hypothetical protein